MSLTIDPTVSARFPALRALTHHLTNLHVVTEHSALERRKQELYRWVRQTYHLDSLKDQSLLRAYRDFFWHVGIDPTKTRPAAEALLRRILGGRELPRINTLVDAYNIASVESAVALAAFDATHVHGALRMRFARPDELFLGIGMAEAATLSGVEVVVQDDERLVAIYPYRDADHSKITLATDQVILMICGVPGIPSTVLEAARDRATAYIHEFCGPSGAGA